MSFFGSHFYCYTSHMMSQKQLWYLLGVAILNISIAFILGNDGYEAFISGLVAMGFLLCWQSVQLIRSVFGSGAWVGLKIVTPLLVLLCSLILAFAVLFALIRPYQDARIPDPTINWLIIFIGATPYIFSRVLFSLRHQSVQQNLAG